MEGRDERPAPVLLSGGRLPAPQVPRQQVPHHAREAIRVNTSGWICLMYHDVVGRGVSLSGGNEHFSVPLTSFEAHLDQLADLGLSGCTIEQALVGSGRRVAVSVYD